MELWQSHSHVKTHVIYSRQADYISEEEFTTFCYEAGYQLESDVHFATFLKKMYNYPLTFQLEHLILDSININHSTYFILFLYTP